MTTARQREKYIWGKGKESETMLYKFMTIFMKGKTQKI